jgi:hypothetical protein
MCHNDGLADGQPEPVAGYVRVLGRLLAEEGLENALAISSGDTWPLVFDAQHQFAVIRDPSRNVDRGAWRRVLDRVLDQVGDHTLHPTGVHPDRWERWRDIKPQPALSRLGLE